MLVYFLFENMKRKRNVIVAIHLIISYKYTYLQVNITVQDCFIKHRILHSFIIIHQLTRPDQL